MSSRWSCCFDSAAASAPVVPLCTHCGQRPRYQEPGGTVHPYLLLLALLHVHCAACTCMREGASRLFYLYEWDVAVDCYHFPVCVPGFALSCHTKAHQNTHPWEQVLRQGVRRRGPGCSASPTSHVCAVWRQACICGARAGPPVLWEVLPRPGHSRSQADSAT